MTPSHLVATGSLREKDFCSLLKDFALERDSVQNEINEKMVKGEDLSLVHKFEDELEKTDHMHLVHFN